MALQRPAPNGAPLTSLLHLVPFALVGGLLAGCTSSDDDSITIPPDTSASASLKGIDTSGGTDGIVALPASVDDRIEAVFDRYTQFTAPNGSRVHFLSQTAVSDDLLIRTRGLVRQHFFDVPGSAMGADKSAAFNRAGTAGATFVIHENAASFDAANADVIAFDTLFDDSYMALDASTIVQEASTAYLQPSPAFDASIDATVRFALEQGISEGVPAFQTALDAATTNAVTNIIYTPNVGTAAGQVDDEYLALALSTYYGLYAHDPNSDGTSGANSEYDVLDRADMQTADPDMFALIEGFFRPTHRYSAFLDTSFNGDFEMAFDVAVPYTHRSRYLERAGLRGVSTARLNGNDLDNILVGNAVNSTFEGAGGNDVIESEGGNDFAIMTGVQAEYTITDVGDNVTQIVDSVMGRDGTDLVRGITQVTFSDGTINL